MENNKFINTFQILMVSQVMIYSSVMGNVSGPTGDTQDVRVLAGSRVLMPCNITPEASTDAPILVLYYSGATGMPIYSIDARGGELVKSRHWSALSNRAHFNTAPGHQGLVIDSIQVDDAGTYRCRVDFRASPTRNMRVNLNVIVPPKRVTISDDSGQSMSGVIGPFKIGTTVTLTCQVTGGVPRPKVAWWQENTILDDMEEVRTMDAIQNVLTLPNLSKQYLFRRLSCKAENSNLTSPLIATVTLDVNFPPKEVKITGAENPLSAGRTTWVTCESSGSRPPAKLTWYMDRTQIVDSSSQVIQKDNVSISRLQILPTEHHDGATLCCRADNPVFSTAAIEDTHKLTVHYSPKLHLQAGLNIDLTDIREGADIYFECSILANPMVSKVKWYLNDKELHQNVSMGIIRSNQSLVLQKITRTCSGNYTCQASNLHGKGISNAVALRVKFAPVCSKSQRWIYGGGREHPVNVTCNLDAHPEASHFRWAFNTSSEYVDIPESRIRRGRGRSMVAYTPQTHHDFGSLICWGVNEVGMQRLPCVYHIVPASVPEPVQNCSSWQNASASGEVVVSCVHGLGGGLPQTFSLEVKPLAISINTIEESKVLISYSDKWKPYFKVTGLKPGKEYQLKIFSVNDRGKSKPFRFVHMTPIDVAEKRTSVMATERTVSEEEEALFPLMAILIGLVVTLALCSMALVVVVRAKMKRKTGRRAKGGGGGGGSPQKGEDSDYEKSPRSRKEGPEVEDYVQTEERKPDVILVENAEDKIPGDGEQQLLTEYVRPGYNPCQKKKWASLQPGIPEFSFVQQHKKPLRSAVSIQSIHSLTAYHGEPLGSQSMGLPGPLRRPLLGLYPTTYSRGQLIEGFQKGIHKGLSVTSGASPTSPVLPLAGFPPPLDYTMHRGSIGHLTLHPNNLPGLVLPPVPAPFSFSSRPDDQNTGCQESQV